MSVPQSPKAAPTVENNSKSRKAGPIEAKEHPKKRKAQLPLEAKNSFHRAASRKRNSTKSPQSVRSARVRQVVTRARRRKPDTLSVSILDSPNMASRHSISLQSGTGDYAQIAFEAGLRSDSSRKGPAASGAARSEAIQDDPLDSSHLVSKKVVPTRSVGSPRTSKARRGKLRSKAKTVVSH